MRTTVAQGIRSADVIATPEADFRTFQAGEDITVGQAVMLEIPATTANTNGYEVLAATAAGTTEARFIGIYTGLGGTGAATTVSGLSGKDASDGDIIDIQTYGLAEALVNGGTDVTAGDPLTPNASAEMIKVTTIVAEQKYHCIAVDAQTGSVAVASTVWLNV